MVLKLFIVRISPVSYTHLIRPGIVHRFDKDTSGIMIVAKNDAAHISLSEQIQNKTAKRSYIAIVRGNIKEDTGTISAKIARDKNDRKKMTVVQEGGRTAVTDYEVLERFGRFTIVRLSLIHIADRNTEELENIAAAENDVGQRLDIYLAAKLEVSRSNMQKLLEEGRVFRGAKVFKANYKVKAGDVFTVMLPEPELLEIRSEAIPCLLYTSRCV